MRATCVAFAGSAANLIQSQYRQVIKIRKPRSGSMLLQSLLTLRWREVDSNFPFRALNEHRTAPGQDFCYPFDLQSV